LHSANNFGIDLLDFSHEWACHENIAYAAIKPLEQNTTVIVLISFRSLVSDFTGFLINDPMASDILFAYHARHEDSILSM
jgi:hypothetical protein